LSNLFHSALRVLLHLGFFGPLLLGIFDSSFLFLPFGNDLLVVALTARHHAGYLLYVISAAIGSTLGVLLLDLVARKLGEEGINRVAGSRRFEYLKRKVGQHGGKAILLGCLAPPPFPFTLAVMVNSALSYPRKRLVLTVAAGRAIRFLLLGALAIRFGRTILKIAGSAAFKNFMYVFTAICLTGSVLSIIKWTRKGYSSKASLPGQTAPEG